MSANPFANPYAQLRALSSSDAGFDVGNNSQDLVLEFPVMPQTVPLSRRSNYQVASVLPLPDGLHIYKNTEPMAISLTFKLHAFSDYATNGAATLLQMAGILHAMSVPLRNGGALPSTTAQTAQEKAVAGGNYYDNFQQGLNYNGANNPNNGTYQAGSSSPGTNGSAGTNVSSVSGDGSGLSNLQGFGNGQVPAFPAVCALRIINLASGGWGVKCVGYVKDVDVTLKEPWLQADDGSYNLPSSAEFKFTFIHAPSYRNKTVNSNSAGLNLAGSSTSQFFAEDIRDNLYNSEQLALSSGTSNIVALPPIGSVFSATPSSTSTPVSASDTAAGTALLNSTAAPTPSLLGSTVTNNTPGFNTSLGGS